jgi:DNA-binding GntR family transcriptional regulator
MPRSAAATPPAPTADSVHAEVFSAIVDQRLVPGDRLNELGMSRHFGISRRELDRVIGRLVHEGLATIEPNRGAFVARPDVQEARAIFAARKVIEAGVVEAAALRASGADYKALEQNVGEEEAARRAGRMRDAVRHSGHFHLLLAEIAGNPVLLRSLRELVARTSLVTSLYENPNGLSCWHDDHGELVKLLRARKARQAMEIMRRHLDHLEEGLDLRRKPVARADLRAIFGAPAPGSRRAA